MELVLEVINTPELKEGCSQSWRFKQSGGVLGRSPECEWRIEDQSFYVSRQHARVSHDDNAFYLTDISRNGILLNGVETI
ncbi:FHA domain-containing protein, partial [Pseudomonas viridiflava]